MRFATRAFLWSFVPFVLLILGSFWNIQKLVQLSVRDGIRTSLRQTHESIASLRSKSELQNIRFLRVAGENASLKAGLQLLNTEVNNDQARLTVEDQLREISETLGVDFILVSSPNGNPRAGVMRLGEQLVTMDSARIRPPQHGFFQVEKHVYQIASTPINQGNENLGILTIGERFDLSAFSTPAVLIQRGQVLESSVPGVSEAAAGAALSSCQADKECEIRLGGEGYLTLPVESLSSDGFSLRTLQSLDAATRPLQRVLQNVFLIAGLATLLATVILTVLCSRSIVKPIAGVVARLRETERTGMLPEFRTDGGTTPIQEIRELTHAFNQAGRAIRDGRESLHGAYVEFVGSLANALDARDPYTAGHSRRVSDYSCAIASAIGLSGESVEDIRIGALLHDIGKIGIADSALQKPGKLSRDEWALIQQHPTIGRRILEGVGGFQPYLPTVELHHENWNGTGYPFGLRGEAVPLAARIVHVADAYDAMTSSRPYRRAMNREEALRILTENAGTQFDPAIVPVFAGVLASEDNPAADREDETLRSIHNLNLALATAGEPAHREEAAL
ncbi:MAG TPA: HD domain-containing phosphohydrolase [Bryobacteraceae bacterium]|jgi:HD-GYP domain-containing protein (c-di-GMP phosphodiesterase class II)